MKRKPNWQWTWWHTGYQFATVYDANVYKVDSYDVDTPSELSFIPLYAWRLGELWDAQDLENFYSEVEAHHLAVAA